jgi:hypothetical protein
MLVLGKEKKFNYKSYGKKCCPKCNIFEGDQNYKTENQPTKKSSVVICSHCRSKICFRCNQCNDEKKETVFYNIKNIPYHLRYHHKLEIKKRKRDSPESLQKTFVIDKSSEKSVEI